MELDTTISSVGCSSVVINYFNSTEIALDFSENTEIVSRITSVSSGLMELWKGRMNVDIMTKLRAFYIGAIISHKCELIRQKLPPMNPRKAEIKVNDELIPILQECKLINLQAVVVDDFETRALGQGREVTREYFRQWKCRILKFFAICGIEKKLLFTDLPFSVITRTFPDVDSTKSIFEYIRNHPEANFPDWLKLT